MGDYDVRLKLAFGEEGIDLMRFLFSEEISRQVNTRVLRGDPREVDFLARRSDGGLLHVEFQTASEAEMPWRMLNYRVAITERESGWIEPHVFIRQIVLYFGRTQTGMRPLLKTDEINFNFEVIDVRKAVPPGLSVDLKQSFEKNLLIALAAGKIVNRRWVANANEWRKLAWQACQFQRKERRSDCVRTVELFATLRRMESAVAEILQETLEMPLDFDIENTVYSKQLYVQGRSDGYHAGISAGLRTLRELVERKFRRAGAEDGDLIYLRDLNMDTLSALHEELEDGTSFDDALRNVGVNYGR